ncbi:unnamed protein product [Zymoseptoria tritici ST99CH_1A5]|uniref:DUF1783-domain-containing protein n=3 Tax=Zymoseptoria tritici TaxID=1047171 RepID=F9XNT4_ZYMTI|nr:uncharacterized protein MYCGRDRAFT_77442 [Zymoseptoria tritici IPO323]EGP83114.1 hypothetical protein MYCGRDRAFT_77442 [Zymoseptoria tritici IPO323]SMQ55770.1 unnamed protein product [Zymoseptoria tritici ST99CH_3D7]SMR64103.1 unnamed protein product [Zymoseptoria tritici ST99CH_3D1]SMY29451.1 unnamed protein product [Zymoseptoria tritici ST99CH_1A5]
MLPRPRLRLGNLPTLLRIQHVSRRTLVAAPRPGSGPLMERRADRDLPSISTSTRNGWIRTIPLFAVIVVGSALAIFNYQKTSSSVVSSTLYAVRTNPEARAILGDEIYFASQIPWIRGELNQMQGRIDISFWVKGTKGQGKMRFKSMRKTRMGIFETLEWSLEPEGGQKISLLDNEGRDPFQRIVEE